MSVRDSSRSRFGAQRLRRSMGDQLGAGAVRVRPGEVVLEVFGQALVQPERQVAEGAAEQGMRRLVPQVFLEPGLAKV